MKTLIVKFREFRWTRPFWGGLFLLAGGVIIGYLPLSPVTDIIKLGVGGISGYLCALILLIMGLAAWFRPSQRRSAGLIGIVVSLISFPLSNLGGFVVGMMAGIIGGCMVFAWTPGGDDDDDADSPNSKADDPKGSASTDPSTAPTVVATGRNS